MKILYTILVGVFTLFAANAFAQNTLKLELVPAAPLQAGKTVKVTVKLTDIKTGKPVGESALKAAHTSKLHLLVVDETLGDYHHLHPVEIKNGEWIVDFTPKMLANYRVWADVLPTATKQQEYVVADIGGIVYVRQPNINKTVNLKSAIGEYEFTLKLDGELSAGKATMASITVSKNAKPFTQLEPVMGAFAHMVGFGEDYKSIMHVHPMGTEPSKESERGGAILEFHIEPEAAGFAKIFAQFRIDGKDVFVPFGVMVK